MTRLIFWSVFTVTATLIAVSVILTAGDRGYGRTWEQVDALDEGDS